MRRFHTLALGMLILAVIALSAVFIKSSLNVAAEHDAFAADLRQLAALDGGINLGVLSARYSPSRSYDQLAADVGRMQGLLESIRPPA